LPHQIPVALRKDSTGAEVDHDDRVVGLHDDVRRMWIAVKEWTFVK